MIKRYIELYDFEKIEFQPSDKFTYPKDGFVIKISLKSIPCSNHTLFDFGNSIKIVSRFLTQEDKNKLTGYEKGECYFQETDKNGCAPVLETLINLSSKNHPDWKEMKLGINLLQYDLTKEDLYIVYDTVNFRLIYDNRVINNNLPFGVLDVPNEKIVIDNEYINNISFSDDIKNARYYRDFEILDKKMNFYTPYSHNLYIGDVVNFYHNGVYHMLYMPDRHHHGNRWGGGGHHFEHLITKDFIDWEDVGPIWDIEKQWESVGTGTMFFHDGKYYVAYGLHTERTIPQDKVIMRDLDKYYEKFGETRVYTFEEIKNMGKYPGGGTYSVSNDGIHFEKSEKIFSVCENPSIYSVDGKLLMYGGFGDYCNAWYSEGMDKPWKKSKDQAFGCGANTPMRNTFECPSFFEWNGYKYLIMGFTGFWRTEKDKDEYIDVCSQGYDVYDGLNVPMAVKTDDNRVILAGWLGGMSWGSFVLHRELVQYEDGNLGMKWLPELFPKTSDKISLSPDLCTDLKDKTSYYLEAEIDPKKGDKFSVVLFGNNENVELSLDLSDNTAQYCKYKDGTVTPKIPPMYKAINMYNQTENGRELYGSNLKPETMPRNSGDFSIAHVKYPKKPFKVKMMIHFSKKAEGTIIDTEIAETRTLVSYRKDFVCNKIKTDKNIENAHIFEADL